MAWLPDRHQHSVPKRTVRRPAGRGLSRGEEQPPFATSHPPSPTATPAAPHPKNTLGSPGPQGITRWPDVASSPCHLNTEWSPLCGLCHRGQQSSWGERGITVTVSQEVSFWDPVGAAPLLRPQPRGDPLLPVGKAGRWGKSGGEQVNDYLLHNNDSFHSSSRLILPEWLLNDPIYLQLLRHSPNTKENGTTSLTSWQRFLIHLGFLTHRVPGNDLVLN